MSRVSDATALATGFCVSPLWRAESSAQPAGPAAVWAMRLSGFGDGGHDFPGHAPAAAHLVSDHVVGDQPEKRGERTGTAKHLGSGKLPYRLGVAAQAAAQAMVRPGRERLSGRVEVDETYVGGAEEGLRGRQTQKKALVAIAAEEDGAGIGRIRMKRIRGASKQQLCTASSKRLSSPTARSTPTAGKGTSAWRRLAIGTSTTFWPVRASRPPSCCPTFTGWLPC